MPILGPSMWGRGPEAIWKAHVGTTGPELGHWMVCKGGSSGTQVSTQSPVGRGRYRPCSQALVRPPGNTGIMRRPRSPRAENGKAGWWAVRGLEARQDGAASFPREGWSLASCGPQGLGENTRPAERGNDFSPHMRIAHPWPAWAGMNAQPRQGGASHRPDQQPGGATLPQGLINTTQPGAGLKEGMSQGSLTITPLGR